VLEVGGEARPAFGTRHRQAGERLFTEMSLSDRGQQAGGDPGRPAARGGGDHDDTEFRVEHRGAPRDGKPDRPATDDGHIRDPDRIDGAAHLTASPMTANSSAVARRGSAALATAPITATPWAPAASTSATRRGVMPATAMTGIDTASATLRTPSTPKGLGRPVFDVVANVGPTPT